MRATSRTVRFVLLTRHLSEPNAVAGNGDEVARLGPSRKTAARASSTG